VRDDAPVNLSGAVAVVTGASSGIGRATALALAKEGTRVALAARNRSELEATAAEISARGGEALVVPTDVCDRAQVERLVEAAVERWGKVDVLVANAGAYVRKPALELGVEEIERSLAVNFYGALYPVLALLPRMIERGRGQIVLVDSIDGRKALPGDAPYAVAKFALSGLGQALRQELRPHGIGVTIVYPGRVDTAMIAELRVPRISRKLSPGRIARAIVAAIRRNRAEVLVPRLGRLLLLVDLLSPRAGDWFVEHLHLTGSEQSRPR
jgi:NADP-dependent 3-hydroxy acid dehydrogenase YdfG